MTQTNNTNWIDAWLETQRGWLGRWQATSMEQRVDAMRVSMETFRQQCSPASMSPEALNLAQSFQSLLQSCMAQSTATTQQMAASSDSQQPLNMWQQVLSAFPLGQAREQTLMWQAYLKALGEYQLRSSTLLQAFAQVFTQSLQVVPDEVAKRSAAGKPIGSIRDLYELWVECGERAFAKIAQDETFINTQAASANALSRLQSAEHALLEHWLKSRDLPTRTELNSVHQKLRTLSARIVELEQKLQTRPAPAKTTRSRKK